MTDSAQKNKVQLPNLASAVREPDFAAHFSAWFEHGPFAFWITESLHPHCFVELGTHTGFSYFCFCQAVKHVQTGTACYAIDTWKGDEHANFYGEEIFQGCVTENSKYKGFSTLVRSTFDDALAYFPDNSVDLLHIDGRHFYDDVRHDFETWCPKLTANAIVLFHDTNVRERNFGVWKLFDELKVNHPTFEFLHGYGLGVLAMGEIPAALSGLFAADRAQTIEIRQIFAPLGAKILQKWELAQQLNSSAAERELLKTKKESLEQANAEFVQKHEETAEKFEELSARSAMLGEQSKKLSEILVEMERGIQQKNAFAVQLMQTSRRRHRVKPWVARMMLSVKKILGARNATVRIVKNSPLFDANWYLTKYPDVAASKSDPAKHYAKYGAAEGRDPGPLFSTSSYLALNPDVANNKINPLVHFDRHGWREERPIFGKRLEEKLDDEDRLSIKRHMSKFYRNPLISIVMPAYNSNEEFFRQAINSVLVQLYQNWELCIANDASPNPEVARIIDEYAAKDARIKVVHRAQNGNISAASNSALELATGEFIALMDHDDLLHETALYEIAAEINAHPEADILYSDEDKVDENNRRYSPYYKTDFNPELVLGQNMISHLGVYRHSLLSKIRGFREGFEGSQDYDLFLRAWSASSSKVIRHIPAVLYHWRIDSRSTSFSQTQLDRCSDAARRAVQDFLDKEGEGARVIESLEQPQYSRILRKIPDPAPLVTAIVLTKDAANLLSVCVKGLLEGTNYPNLEVLIVNHDSEKKETLELLAKLQLDPRVRILPYSGEFNYSAMNNMAAREARGSVLLLLNNDIEMLHEDWLAEMVAHAIRPQVGAVGAKLYYPDSRIQHAGVVVGIGGVAGHSFLFEPKDAPGYFFQACLTRAVSAVTAACLVVRKDIFFEVDGLNEVDLKVAFNDVDLCLKVQEKGYRNVWTPFAQLIHHESATRGSDQTPKKRARFQHEVSYIKERWAVVIKNDPFYNPNLSLQSMTHDPAISSRRIAPWKGV